MPQTVFCMSIKTCTARDSFHGSSLRDLRYAKESVIIMEVAISMMMGVEARILNAIYGCVD